LPVISGLAISFRLFIEVVTAVGMLSGIHFANGIFLKLLFFVFGVAVIFIWNRYSAPKSPNALTGLDKLVLEMLIYGIGVVSFVTIFGRKVGIIYAVIALIDLFIMYTSEKQRD